MRKKSLNNLTVIILCIALCAITFWGTYAFTNVNPAQSETNPTLDEMYMTAVKDAAFIEEDEKLPVLTVTKDEELMMWKDNRVLMITYHRFPQSYEAGSTVTTDWGNVWVTSFAEWRDWYSENYPEETNENWTLRFNQLLGMSPDNKYTHFSALWVDPSDLVRPAYNPYIENGEILDSLPEICDEAYTEWFEDNIIHSYFDSAYPWTRLGYTYDWADNGTEYGLSEFLIKQGSEVYVEFTCTTDEYVNLLSGKSLEAA